MSALAPASAPERRDLLAGFVLAAAGAFVIWEAGHYARGTLARMGPGFYPTLLGVALVGVGALLALNRGDAAEEEGVPALDWRGAGCIVAGVLLFLLLGEYAGFAPAIFGCVLVSALGDRTASLRGADALSRAPRFMAADKGQAAAFEGADLVVIDELPGFEAAFGAPLDQLAARHPGTVFGVSSVFGLSGPLAGAPASALDAQAASSTAWVLGEAGRTPLSVPPGVLDCQAGAHLAAACLAARHAGLPRGRGQVVDIALAAVLAAYVAVNCRFYIHHGMQWARAGRRASNSGGAYPFVILPCKDGDVCLSGRTRPEWERFVQAMGSPDWAREPRYTKLRAMGQQYPEEVDALILPWLAARTKAEIAAVAHEHQLTIAPLRQFDEIRATPQLAERGFLRE